MTGNAERAPKPTCPHLGLRADPFSICLEPTEMHCCCIAGRKQAITLAHQAAYCLSGDFAACPQFPVTQNGESSATDRPEPSLASVPVAATAEDTTRLPPSVSTDIEGPVGEVSGTVQKQLERDEAQKGSDLRATGEVTERPTQEHPESQAPKVESSSSKRPPLMKRVSKLPRPGDAPPPTRARQARPVLIEKRETAQTDFDSARTPRWRVRRALAVLLAALALLAPIAALFELGFLPFGRQTPSTVSVSARQSIAPTAESTAIPSRTSEVKVVGIVIPPSAVQPPTAVPTPTAEPTQIPPTAVLSAASATSSTGETRFHTVLTESFLDNQRSWPNDGQKSAWLDAGRYLLHARDPGRFVAVGAPGGESFSDVVVTGRFRKIGGPMGGGAGIILRDQGPGPRDGINQNGTFYVFEVGDRGEVGIWRREASSWVDLLPWTPSEAVRPGGAVNELTARALGTRLTFLVNGVEVASLEDSVLREGGVGLFVGGDLNEVVVEHFEVQIPN